MQLLSDNPITKLDGDKFGFKSYVEILGETIIDTQSLPFTIGIFGEWGTGKTSLMYLLRNWLNDGGCKTVWFNPWKYDNKEELWAALIQSILLEIHTEAEKNKNNELKKKAWELFRNIAWFTVKEGINKATCGIIDKDKIEEIKNIFANFNKEEYIFLNKFEKDFEELVKEYVGTDGRLVIFIDDLDRCIPENSITILESLKLYLDNSRCIFVLGMDRLIVELGIQHRYGKSINISGREYLEKIIQLAFFIPPIQFENLKNSLENKTKAANYTSQIWELLNYGLGGNPRKAKRFVNSFYLVQKALESRINVGQPLVDDSDKFDDIPYEDKLFYLAKILIIQMIFPDFYDYLVYNSEGWELFEKILNKEDSTKVENIFKEYPEIKKFSENKNLKKFMYDTCCHINDVVPQTPSPTTIERIIQLTGIVEGKTSKTSVKVEGTAEPYEPSSSGYTTMDHSTTSVPR
jgi:phosphopantetheinyl transferase (holo-ACP synthase)